MNTLIASIDDLELAARLVVEGLRTGQHRSPLHGFTAEFSQHRPYRAGDDLKSSTGNCSRAPIACIPASSAKRRIWQ